MSQSATAGIPTSVYTPGVFVWHELQTKDVAKAERFYVELLGWNIKAVEMGGGMTYHLIYVGDKQIGGMCNAMAPEVPSYWGGYVSVPDVDQAAKTAKAQGGQVVVEPMDIPNVGRFALVIDPQGAAINLFKSSHGDPDTQGMPTAGEFCWDALDTTDLAAAAAFYEKVVGWQADAGNGEGGMFKYGDMGEASFGKAPAGTPAQWVTHIAVADLAVAVQKAVSLGATVLMADIEAGPWGRFTMIQDPTGAVVSLFEGKQQ